MMEAAEQLVVNRWLASVDEHKASDLLLSVGNPPTLRIQGKLFPLPNEALLVPDFMRRLSESWLTPEQLKQLDVQRQVSFGLTMANRRRFKIDTFYQGGFISMTLRLVPDRIPAWDQIGLPPQVQSIANAEHGLIIVCGPFGSGRTTTVVSIINYINRLKTKHIVTFEDPIEYQFADDHSVIEQRELRTDVPDVVKGLELLMNEDADVVVLTLGHQPEVARRVMELVNAGRLVILTMNIHSGIQALQKFVLSFPEAEQGSVFMMLSQSLLGVINQRIIPTLGGGQVLAAEIILPTEPVRTALQSGDVYKVGDLLHTQQVEGLQSLDQALAQLVRNGDITRETASSFALDQGMLSAYISAVNRQV